MKAAARALAAALLVAALLGPAGASGAQTQARARMSLSGQSPWVGRGGEFVLRLRIDRSGLPSNATVALTVFRPVETRSEFEQTIDGRIVRSSLDTFTFTLGGLTADQAGDVTVRVPLQDPNQPADANRIEVGSDDGVFPLRVELRDASGTSLERFTTHLVYLPGTHTGFKLGASFVLPLTAGAALPPDGRHELPDLDGLTTAVQALEAFRAVPFVLKPSPETVAAIDASTEEKAGRALDSLRRIAADRPVVAGSYVPVNVTSLVDSGLASELDAQLARGSSVLTESLHARPDTHTWIETGPLDPESIDEIVRRGIDRVVASDSVLEAEPALSVTLSRPFVLGGREEDVPAVVADGGLTSHFNGGPNPVLQANRLLADFAVLWLDAPGSERRAVVAMPPPDWKATRAFLDTVAAGLAQHPVVEAVSLDTIFTGVSPAITSRGSALVRHPAPVPPGGLGDVADDIRDARRRLLSLASVIEAPTAGSTLLEDRLLAAESSELRTNRARQSYLSAVDAGIADHLDAIEMPQGRSITLTARRGQIPVTFQNRTGAPARVIVTVQSDKLEFPDGTTRALELARRNTTERFSVVARTSGAFPLRITLQSPDGNLLIGNTRLTVRSTAASRVSVAVSAGALLFLVVWWGRHVVRGRRARRLVPA
ncbi:MAG: DUF6049 family protein [Actinomycetota bacterium]|nr:DUF6049 family protein [Actinomycetota bacterium]